MSIAITNSQQAEVHLYIKLDNFILKSVKLCASYQQLISTF